MADRLGEKARKALQEATFWTIATVNPDGSPQATVVWIDLRDDHILVNSAVGRRKPRNVERDPRVALTWFDPNSVFETIQIQGRVARSYTGEQADADIDALARKYLGRDYPFRREGEQRISFLIEPTHSSEP